MPYVKVYIHFVWTTKKKQPLLNSSDMRQIVWQHIRDNAREKGIFIDFINGWVDHCHCLISLGVAQTMSDVMKLIKGESSFWINKNNVCSGKFEWQDEYYAVSVSERGIDIVREYIRNQEAHHRHKTWDQECDTFMKEHGFQKYSTR